MKEHFLKEKTDGYGSYFRHVIGIYALFHFAFVLTGGMLFYAKTGLQIERIFESVHGSEQMLAVFPNAKDHFVNPKTVEGLIKISLPHSMVIALVIFISSHLMAALAHAKQQVFLRFLTAIAFVFAFLEIFFPLFFLLGPKNLVYSKIPIFLLFSLTQSMLSLGLIFLSFPRKNH